MRRAIFYGRFLKLGVKFFFYMDNATYVNYFFN